MPGLLPRLALCSLLSRVLAGRIAQSVPEDPYAFPKYRTTFLNGLPVLNETAERWLRDGLKGGEAEFLEHPYDEHEWNAPQPWKEIGSGGPSAEGVASPASSPSHRLEHLKLGPKMSYLCLIPPPLQTSAPDSDEPQEEVTPAQSWSLLQPLSNSCLYHRQSWFTYAYCHNSHVRQFRERPHSHPHPPGGHVPEEDPNYDAYTLGVAPPVPEPGTELSVAQQQALSANLELAESAGSSYLVQRWTDGTVCDKTGRGRTIEVQFHCSSMAMSDTVLFVKETKTCHYTLVIHTPRLCGLPGFRSAAARAHEQATIRCREIVSTLADANKGLPEADFPIKMPQRQKPVLPPPPPPPPVKQASTDKGAGFIGGLSKDALRKAFVALTGKEPREGELATAIVLEEQDNGDFVMKLIDDEADDGFYEDDFDYVQGERDPPPARQLQEEKFAQLLKAAGIDVFGAKPKQGAKDEKKDKKGKKGASQPLDDEDDEVPQVRDGL